MSKYVVEHADALADVRDAGSAVVFSGSVTVTGFAIRVGANAARYAGLNLGLAEAATLLFVPSTYGDKPEPGDVCDWTGIGYTVADVQPMGPDGTAILSRVIVKR